MARNWQPIDTCPFTGVHSATVRVRAQADDADGFLAIWARIPVDKPDDYDWYNHDWSYPNHDYVDGWLTSPRHKPIPFEPTEWAPVLEEDDTMNATTQTQPVLAAVPAEPRFGISEKHAYADGQGKLHHTLTLAANADLSRLGQHLLKTYSNDMAAGLLHHKDDLLHLFNCLDTADNDAVEDTGSQA